MAQCDRNTGCERVSVDVDIEDLWEAETRGFFGMSINERLKARHSPDSTPGVLSRSRSLIGLFSHRRTASSGGTPTSSYTDGSNISAGGSSNSSTLSRGSVLGQYYSPNTTRRVLEGSSTWLSKPPKAPRPERALAMFQAVNSGLRECINLTQDDIVNLRTSAEGFTVNTQFQGKLYEVEKQYKTAERYLKRLEFQLAKLEELQDQYKIHQKMRDGVRTMAYAYVLSPGKEKESALHNVRSGYRECTDTLCNIEAELECMMGTMLFNIKGIQGFARLCAGDVFEVTMKNGHQKWKTRGKILKGENQAWDNKKVIFKAQIGEVLYIKAVEVKGLGKNIVLGQKYCDTKELFSAHPQLMTVNLNPSGSLKLNVVVTWNPLHGCTEDTISRTLPSLSSTLSSPISRQQSSPQSFLEGENCRVRSPGSVWSSSQHGSHRMEMLHNFRSNCGRACASAPGSTVTTPDVEAMGLPSSVHAHSALLSRTGGLSSSRLLRSSSVAMTTHALTTSIHSSQIQKADQPQLQLVETTTSQRWSGIQSADSSECCSMDFGSSSVGSHVDSSSLYEIVHSLGTCLEDIQGQYPELLPLQQSLIEMERVFRKDVGSGKESSGSRVSMSVESALGCFDFLNSALDSDSEMIEESVIVEHNRNVNPDNSAKTSDLELDSFAQHLVEHQKEQISPSLGISLHPSSTGSEQLDRVIYTHLVYCQRLVEDLGSFGPLKCRELYSLDKLRRQTPVLKTVLDLIYNWRDHERLTSGKVLLSNYPELQNFWDNCCGGQDMLCLSVEQIVPLLTGFLNDMFQKKSHQTCTKVAKHFVCKVLDVIRCEPDNILTVLQLQQYYENQNCSLINLFNRLIDEVTQIEILHSGDEPAIKKLLSTCKKCMPSSRTLLAIGWLFTLIDSGLPKLAESYLKDVAKNSSTRKFIISVFLEGLESDDSHIRQGSCCALATLKATEHIELLVYLSHVDENLLVQQQAKNTLFKFGEDGKRAYEQCQFSTQGFQGFNVK
ncbi:rho family-interacting cell polarization regulator 2-like isoform X3 [Tachypleus tridentatus]|uniref:rho family-interacting cell polarization regulator 2-like isoform X3 n=1 Tax=Tachypleus tridentatus TaxID=6853 RepID=UPI003FD440C7